MDKKMHPLEAFALTIDAAENYLKWLKHEGIEHDLQGMLERAIPVVDEVWRATMTIAISEIGMRGTTDKKGLN